MTDIDAIEALAHEIRRVDGNHDKGAASLAEALWPFISKLAPVHAQDAQKAQGEILQLLRDIEANVQRAWKDGSLSAKAWPADIGRRLSDAVNAQDAEGTQGAQGAEGVEALAAEGLEYFERAGDAGDRKYVDAIREVIRRLRNSPESTGLLSLIADIRAAAGDPTGKLMQGELVAHIGALRLGAERYGWFKRKFEAMDSEAQDVVLEALGIEHSFWLGICHHIDAARSAGGDDEA